MQGEGDGVSAIQGGCVADGEGFGCFLGEYESGFVETRRERLISTCAIVLISVCSLDSRC